jgi:hypothetical protein
MRPTQHNDHSTKRKIALTECQPPQRQNTRQDMSCTTYHKKYVQIRRIIDRIDDLTFSHIIVIERDDTYCNDIHPTL